MLRLKSKKIKFTAECDRVLKESVIDESGPGTILQDFDRLLDFINERDCPLTATYQLPLGLLPEINSRLSHPMEQGLRRPQQKSYPYIKGLYLLLRASGVTIVDETTKRRLLMLDNGALESWKTLNHTERYCSLLETWFLRGKPEIIGESGSGFIVPDNFERCLNFLEMLPKNGMRVGGGGDVGNLLRFQSYWHNFGLLELFGMITVTHGSPVEGKAWNVELIRRTQFGDALIALLLAEFFGDLERIFTLEDQGEVPFGVFQPILQPYFTDWKNNLTLSEPIFREGAHIFRVSLEKVWYRIAMPADHTLEGLAYAILDAVNFDDDHLYHFSLRNRFGALSYIYSPDMEKGPWASEILVGELQIGVEQKLTFLFDFGEKWKFDAILERVDPAMDIGEPRLLERNGKPPKQYPNWAE